MEDVGIVAHIFHFGYEEIMNMSLDELELFRKMAEKVMEAYK